MQTQQPQGAATEPREGSRDLKGQGAEPVVGQAQSPARCRHRAAGGRALLVRVAWRCLYEVRHNTATQFDRKPAAPQETGTTEDLLELWPPVQTASHPAVDARAAWSQSGEAKSSVLRMGFHQVAKRVRGTGQTMTGKRKGK